MAAHLTEKENYMRMMRGECPEWVPRHTMGLSRDGKPPHDFRIEPYITSKHRYNRGGRDIWGVEFVTSAEAAGGLMPKTSDFIMDDVRKWRDIIKAPDVSNVDWEKAVKDDFKHYGIDPENMAISMNTHMGYFMLLMEFMGFENGLLAMYEEPDECMELFDYLCTFYCGVAEKYAKYCKPDVWQLADDVCAWQAPMISADMYEEMLLPFYVRQCKYATDRGMPINMHVCGKAEAIIDLLVPIGVSAWEPAQSCNDLAAVKAKYGNKLVILGGVDFRDELLRDDVTYEEIYGHMKKTFDMLAPGGGYGFSGGYMGVIGDEKIARKNDMVYQAYQELKDKYY